MNKEQNRDAVSTNLNEVIASIVATEVDKAMSAAFDKFLSQQLAASQAFANESEQDLKGLTRKEVCDFLHISAATLWRLQKSGTLSPFKVGARVLFRKSDIVKLLNI